MALVLKRKQSSVKFQKKYNNIIFMETSEKSFIKTN